MNAYDLEAAGFTFLGGTFVAEDVAEDGVPNVRELVFAPPMWSMRPDIRRPSAESNDDNVRSAKAAFPSSKPEAGNTAGGLGGGPEEVDKDTLVKWAHRRRRAVRSDLCDRSARLAPPCKRSTGPRATRGDGRRGGEDEFDFSDLDDLLSDDVEDDDFTTYLPTPEVA